MRIYRELPLQLLPNYAIFKKALGGLHSWHPELLSDDDDDRFIKRPGVLMSASCIAWNPRAVLEGTRTQRSGNLRKHGGWSRM